MCNDSYDYNDDYNYDYGNFNLLQTTRIYNVFIPLLSCMNNLIKIQIYNTIKLLAYMQ